MEVKRKPRLCDDIEDGIDRLGKTINRNNRMGSRTKKKLDEKKISREKLDKHLHNLTEILSNSNATPIYRRGGIGYMCSYCLQEFPVPADLKQHTLQNHTDGKGIMYSMKCFSMLSEYCTRLDITCLRCTLCHADINTVEELMEHLRDKHKKTIHHDIKNHILPFKFASQQLTCCICSLVFEKFKVLQEHMHTHYRNCICDICDAGFVNQGCLTRHKVTHKTGSFPCSYCSKVFETHVKKKSHEKFVHQTVLNRCGYCFEGFKTLQLKEEHLAKVHGQIPRVNKCKACDKLFPSPRRLREHVQRDHLLEKRHTCTECDMKFFASHQLIDHMVKHTGLKKFQCDLCLKSYGRKNTLKEHMRIHANDRRFKCEHCGQSFLQKCSWKGHMKSKHFEII